MSKKSFVTMALICNLIICVMLCVLYFNGYGEKKRTESESKKETTNIAESDVQQDTSKTNENETTLKDKEEETTRKQNHVTEPDTTTESQTTSQPETTTAIGGNEQATTPAFVNGKTKAVISSACNVRDDANVSSNVIGVTRTGEEYIINTSKCDNNWIAIEYNGTIGYISTGYCTLK